MNISLPDEMKAFVETQVSEGGYSTASEYIRNLVREAQKRAAREKLDQLLLEGLDSGPAIELTPEYWDDLRRRAAERLARAEQDKNDRAE